MAVNPTATVLPGGVMNKQASASRPLDQASQAPRYVPGEACRAEIIRGASAAPWFRERSFGISSAEPGFRR